MSVFISKHKLAYYSVPKIACTSLKTMYFEIENGFPFRSFFASGMKYKIHRVYPARAAQYNVKRTPEGAWTVGVVRDPAARIVSLWQNKVMTYNVLDKGKITLTPEDLAAGLTYRPDLNRFVMCLKRYRELSKIIRSHSFSQSYHLGREVERFDKIYNIKALEDLRKDIGERIETVPELGHSNKTKAKDLSTISDLDAAALTALKERYKRDYWIYRKYL